MSNSQEKTRHQQPRHRKPPRRWPVFGLVCTAALATYRIWRTVTSVWEAVRSLWAPD